MTVVKTGTTRPGIVVRGRGERKKINRKRERWCESSNSGACLASEDGKSKSEGRKKRE